MNVVEHSWNKKTARALVKGFAGCDTFLSCDPDRNGAVAFYSRGDVVACKSMADPLFFSWLEATVIARGYVGLSRLVMVIEKQHVGVNMAATVTMARRAGIVIGAVAMCSRAGVEAINVQPSSWQYPAARAQGITGNRLQHEVVKKVAMVASGKIGARIVAGWDAHTEDQRQGIADTLTIGQFWRNVCEGVWPC